MLSGLEGHSRRFSHYRELLKHYSGLQFSKKIGITDLMDYAITQINVYNNFTYAEGYENRIPSLSPQKGEGDKKNSKPSLTPLLPFWEKRMRADVRSA